MANNTPWYGGKLQYALHTIPMVVANIVLILAPRSLFPHFNVQMGRGVHGLEDSKIWESFIILYFFLEALPVDYYIYMSYGCNSLSIEHGGRAITN